MEQIDENAFKAAKTMPPLESEKHVESSKISEEEFNKLLAEMDNPVLAQKKVAVQIKHFLDNRIKEESQTKAGLSDSTRRWIESYNDILEKIQKALHGDKSLVLNVHTISHSDIASKIRESDFPK